MDRNARQDRLERFAHGCREMGLPMTIQRRLILETVLDRDDHPTSDQVFADVARRLPGISRATVYRTLEILVRLGLITKASHPGRGVRYDGRTEIHHHLVCLRCDRIRDFHDDRLNALSIPDTSTWGFRTVDFSVQLRGICHDCREEERRP